jgi:hypothetical protein
MASDNSFILAKEVREEKAFIERYIHPKIKAKIKDDPCHNGSNKTL